MLFTLGLVLGAVLSALVVFVVSGLAAPIPEVARHGVVAAAAAAAVLRDAGVVRFPLPQNARQVPQTVLAADIARGSLQFGFEMGTGVRTYVSSAVPYALVVALVLTAPPLGTAVAAGVGFGLGRAATPAARYASGNGDSWDVALHAHLRTIKAVAGLALVAVTAVLLLGG